jgi:hypothetical protein
MTKVDCDFYYFTLRGKWKYHGEGVFPTKTSPDEYLEVNHDTIFKANNGMPGIRSDGKDYTIAVIPKEHCTAPFAYPHLIQATERND